MLNFAKVSAASEGALIRAYMTQDKPEPETRLWCTDRAVAVS